VTRDSRRYVVMVSEEMQRLCFPGERWDELQALYPFAVIRSGKDLSKAEWASLCGEMEILVSPWGVPRLPEASRAEELPQYLCYMSGAVGGFLSEKHLALGMRVTNWGDSISHTIAESALMGILACLRHIGYHHEVTHEQKGWRIAGECPDSDSLFDRNVGLIGLGNIAREMIPLLRPFSARVFAYDPYVPDETFQELGVIRVESLEELFRTCPVISNHAAKVDELTGKIDRDMLSLLPNNGVFVNTARGNILVEEDLAAEHEAGRLWSCLDVFDPEPPPPDSPLRNTPRCLITPHQAGPTRDQYFRMGDRALLNLRNWKEGRPLVGEVTAEMLGRMT
jgi:phosphoglycerate dehydrogenase-like enzyme